MQSRNIVKKYIKNSYYHIYNRGVEKREIFCDTQDCSIFLYYIKMYLTPREELLKLQKFGMKINRFIPLNLSEEVDLLAFALMPNHIHLLIKQNTTDGIVKLMRRVTTSYVMYFNRKYNRVGALFQGTYKAGIIETETYLLHLSRYIHLNPIKIQHKINFLEFSSYPYYIKEKNAVWIKPEEILQYFNSAQLMGLKGVYSYKGFIEGYSADPVEILNDLTLEDTHN